MKFLKIKKISIIMLFFMSVLHFFAQDVEKNNQEKKSVFQVAKKKQPKEVCYKKNGYTGCGETLADAKQGWKMAVELDKKKKLDSIAKTQKK